MRIGRDDRRLAAGARTFSVPRASISRSDRRSGGNRRRSLERDVLLGEQRASKTRGQGSTPCVPAVYERSPLECDGIAHDPPEVVDQVRLLARALDLTLPLVSPWVCRRHGGLRSRRAGFDSRAGDRRPGRIIRPSWKTTSSECAGTAHDLAKVGDQVRFLARTCHLSTNGPLIPDAGARRPGSRLQPGRSGFDSHRRLFVSVSSLGAAADRTSRRRSFPLSAAGASAKVSGTNTSQLPRPAGDTR